MNGPAREQAAADAAQEVARLAMSYARRFGKPNPDPVARIFDNSTTRQARSLLIDALVQLLGSFGQEVKVLNALRCIDRISPDDFEALGEFWEIIEDVARAERQDCDDRCAANRRAG